MIPNSHSLRIIDASQKPHRPLPPHRKESPQTLIGKDIKQYAASKIKSYMQEEGTIFSTPQLFLTIYNYNIKELAIPLLLCRSTNKIVNKRKEATTWNYKTSLSLR